VCVVGLGCACCWRIGRLFEAVDGPGWKEEEEEGNAGRDQGVWKKGRDERRHVQAECMHAVRERGDDGDTRSPHIQDFGDYGRGSKPLQRATPCHQAEQADTQRRAS